MTQAHAYQTRSAQRRAMQQNAKESCQRSEVPVQPPSALVERSVCEMSSNTCPSTDLSGRVGSDLSGTSFVEIPAYRSQAPAQLPQEVSTRRSGQIKNPFASQQTSEPYPEDDDFRSGDLSSAAQELPCQSLAPFSDSTMSERFQFNAKREGEMYYGDHLGAEHGAGGDISWDGPPEERTFASCVPHLNEVIAKSARDQAVLAALLQILAHYYIGNGTDNRLASIVFKDMNDQALHMQVCQCVQMVLHQVQGTNEDPKFQGNPLILQQIASIHLQYYIATLQVQTGSILTQLNSEQAKEQQHSLNQFFAQIQHNVQEYAKPCARQQTRQQAHVQQIGRYTVAGYCTSGHRADSFDQLHDQVAECNYQYFGKLCQRLKIKNNADVIGFAQHVWDQVVHRAPQVFKLVELTVTQAQVERVVLLVCFWIAAKQFECRKNMPQGKALAAQANVSASILVAVELNLLNQLDFNILSQYVSEGYAVSEMLNA